MTAFITSKKELIADGIEPMPLSSEDNHSTRYQSPRQKRNTMSLRLKIAVSGVNQSVIKVRKWKCRSDEKWWRQKDESERELKTR